MKEQPTSKDDNELIQRVCRGVASIQEGERLRAYIAGLQSALERSQHQITMLLGARAPVETSAEGPLTEQQRRHMLEMVRELIGLEKSQVWWETPNPMLGNTRPWVMALSGDGRDRRLYKFINESFLNMDDISPAEKATGGPTIDHDLYDGNGRELPENGEVGR